MNTVNLKLLVEASERLPDPATFEQNECTVDVRPRVSDFPFSNNGLDPEEFKMVRVTFVKVYTVIRGIKIREWELVV